MKIGGKKLGKGAGENSTLPDQLLEPALAYLGRKQPSRLSRKSDIAPQ